MKPKIILSFSECKIADEPFLGDDFKGDEKFINDCVKTHGVKREHLTDDDWSDAQPWCFFSSYKAELLSQYIPKINEKFVLHLKTNFSFSLEYPKTINPYYKSYFYTNNNRPRKISVYEKKLIDAIWWFHIANIINFKVKDVYFDVESNEVIISLIEYK